MVIQHFFAYSATCDGVGIAAGSVYGCGSLKDPHNQCPYGIEYGIEAYGSEDPAQAVVDYVWAKFEAGLIDNPRGIWERLVPIYLFSSSNDWTVYTQSMRDVKKQMLNNFAYESQINTHFENEAQHVWSIDSGDCECGTYGDESVDGGVCAHVNNCNYDLSGDMLSDFYGALEPRTTAVQEYNWVNQWQYIDSDLMTETGYKAKGKESFLAEYGYFYVPQNCRDDASKCKLHVHYHGCMDMDWAKREMWTDNIELNEYAESNNFIVFYPQNNGEGGCWNWYQYNIDKDFETQKGKQLNTVYRITQDIVNAVANSTVLSRGEGPPS
jgi:hypothetical protein